MHNKYSIKPFKIKVQLNYNHKVDMGFSCISPALEEWLLKIFESTDCGLKNPEQSPFKLRQARSGVPSGYLFSDVGIGRKSMVLSINTSLARFVEC